jgi:Raf kinase inhibitor-like YbhB/YbcL family protein
MSSKKIQSFREEKIIPHGNRGNRATVHSIAGLEVYCSHFENDQFMPAQYTCDGENHSPPLEILNIPQQAKSLAIIVEDPDALDGIFIHWLIWDLPPVKNIQMQTADGIEGLNDFNVLQYSGPCPPEDRTHRCIFKVYALNELLGLPSGSSVEQLRSAIEDHLVGYGELRGMYKRKNV